MNTITENIKSSFKNYNTVQRLIVINVAVFLLVHISDNLLRLFNFPSHFIINYVDDLFAVPASLSKLIIHPWSLLTYQFMHGGIFHILFNMLWLFFMGRLFTEYIGAKKMLAVYFMGGITGALFFIAAYNILPLFNTSVTVAVAIGASASVLAISMACATLLPDYPVAMFVPTFVVKLKYIALFQLAIDLLSIAGNNAGGSIAHLGGALFGFVFVKQLQGGNDITKWVVTIIEKVEGLFQRKSKIKVVHSRGNTDESYRERKNANQAAIDKILDKISKSGYASLTAEEKDTLFRASKNK